MKIGTTGIAVAVAGIGAAGWISYRKGQQKKLGQALALHKDYRDNAIALAEEHIKILGTNNYKEAYEEITKEHFTSFDDLLRRMGEPGQTTADALRRAEELYDAGQRKVSYASNVGKEYTSAESWSQWFKRQTGYGDSPWGDSPWGATDWDSIVQTDAWGQGGAAEVASMASQPGVVQSAGPVEPYYVAPTSLPSSAQTATVTPTAAPVYTAPPGVSPSITYVHPSALPKGSGPGISAYLPKRQQAQTPEQRALAESKAKAQVMKARFAVIAATLLPLIAAGYAYKTGKSPWKYGAGVAVGEAAAASLLISPFALVVYPFLVPWAFSSDPNPPSAPFARY